MSGFMSADGRRHYGRPCGVAVMRDGSLLLTDDANGIIYRISYDGDRVVLAMEDSNEVAAKALKKKLEQLMNKAGAHPMMLERSLYLGKNIPLNGTAHQAGTLRFGTDPATSVLDLDCKAHELDNLYVTDASFFPSIGAVNPTLTIIANALRVADSIKGRIGSH